MNSKLMPYFRRAAGFGTPVYNLVMPTFKYHHPIEVRYRDLDPQGHVNNAKYLTFMEQARVNYVKHLGLWQGDSFMDIGFILADAHISFKSSIEFGQLVRVGVRTSSIGHKSLHMEYRIEDAQKGKVFSTGSSVLVAYDYHSQETISVPEKWRRVITAYEGLVE
ncbi:MAG: thioesterase family protein [Anaerolineales bacterium]